ncbi:UDP-glycosyltransferase 89B1-like protein [Tanacetum coccineum]
MAIGGEWCALNHLMINANINGDKDDNVLISFPRVPNMPEFSWWRRSFQVGQPDYESFKNNLLENTRSFKALVNTFENMEYALAHSEVDFILCAKPQDSSNIPYAFEEIVNNRGHIIRDWIPQFEILAHPAVGSFPNSCGWNSILDGVKAGVMMLAWPMGSDQSANAKLLVDESDVGKQVYTGGHMSVT